MAATYFKITKNVPQNVTEAIELLGGNNSSVKEYNNEYGVTCYGAKYAIISHETLGAFMDTLVIEPHNVKTTSYDKQEPQDIPLIYKWLIRAKKAYVAISDKPIEQWGSTYSATIIIK